MISRTFEQGIRSTFDNILLKFVSFRFLYSYPMINAQTNFQCVNKEFRGFVTLYFIANPGPTPAVTSDLNCTVCVPALMNN